MAMLTPQCGSTRPDYHPCLRVISYTPASGALKSLVSCLHARFLSPDVKIQSP